MNVPKDNAILLGFLNLKLRDFYSSLSALCDDLELDETEIIAQMSAYGYVYDQARNAFVPA